MANPDNASSVASYQGMLDNLVTQFSSALDCFRELVQNSIDAGTPRVDIWMEYLPGEGHQGTIAIHVDDFGEGMDEAIIDQEFTNLFASGKDDDLTKIGKFGIGFVSVFALEPRAVLVHTGRSGEYWEVLFHEDRSFSKTRVDNPVEGTQITLFLEGEYHRYQALAEEIPETLRYWCNHSEVDVTFEDRTNNDDFAPPEKINEDFGVDGQFLQHIDEHQGTEIVLAYSGEPTYGFYNRGLTLARTDVGDKVLDRWERRFEFVAFKIKSRYLEHTLARDSVIRDEQYQKAMTLLEEAANGPLLDALIDGLADLAQADQWSVEDLQRYGRWMDFLAMEPVEEVARHRETPFLRCHHGDPISPDALYRHYRRSRQILMTDRPSSLTAALHERGVPVLVGVADQSLTGSANLRTVPRILVPLLHQLGAKTARGVFWGAVTTVGNLLGRDVGSPRKDGLRRTIDTPEAIYFPIAIDDPVDAAIQPLLDDAFELLKEGDTSFRRITTGTIEASGDDAPLVVVSDTIDELMARPPQDLADTDRPMEAAINRHHPQFGFIQRGYENDPAMGAYLLARALTLSEDHGLDADATMIDLALQSTRRQFQ